MDKKSSVPIQQHIHLIRGKEVIIDSDLAELYGVPTKRLNEQVKRNIERFPEDFMFQMTKEELAYWRSQIATSNPSKAKMGLRRKPHVFTEQGVAMLSSVLNSPIAVQVNIQIMRAFVQFRRILASNQELLAKITAMEAKYDEQFKMIFEAIRSMIEQKTTKRQIGFAVPSNNQGIISNGG